jgi:hypothetical protein
MKILIKESQYKVLLERGIKSNPNIEKAYNEIVAGAKYLIGTDKTRILKAFDYIKNKQDFETLKSMFKDKRTGYGSFDEMVKEEYDMFDSNDIEKLKNKVKAKPYEVLVGKKPTGQILGPNVDSTRVDDVGHKHIAEVLTGLLDLDGLEDCNKNTFSRNIYFHGTNKEKFLGTPRSNGCIRVSNNDILWMISSLPEGTKVYIKP